jgi:hypothetical protein
MTHDVWEQRDRLLEIVDKLIELAEEQGADLSVEPYATLVGDATEIGEIAADA